MKTPTDTESAVDRIGQLHAEAAQHVTYSRCTLDTALREAWEAGRLLIEENKRCATRDRLSLIDII